jgi:hypothetical protein
LKVVVTIAPCHQADPQAGKQLKHPAQLGVTVQRSPTGWTLEQKY